MEKIETKTHKDWQSAKQRLVELELDIISLLDVRDIALNAAADATPFHPATAPGTLAYFQGTWALRNTFVKPDTNWSKVCLNGVEAIENDNLKIRVIFANVDIACNDDYKPKPRSRKGAGSERICMGNLFENLPEYAPIQRGWGTYYLMVSHNGEVELTMPVVKHGTFTAWLERIYISDGKDFDPTITPNNNEDTLDNFDPIVIRK
jgi:hypothetical protein